jgi:hypothetical protein
MDSNEKSTSDNKSAGNNNPIPSDKPNNNELQIPKITTKPSNKNI